MMLRACQSKFGLVQHHLESYNYFVQRVLPLIVKQDSILVANYPPVSSDKGPVRLEFIFADISIKKPTFKEANGFVKPVTPAMARKRGLTYASSVFVDIEQRTLQMPAPGSSVDALPVLLERKHYSEMMLCRLPVMVGSSLCHLHHTNDSTGECPHDDGGYFITNGMEKIIISQQKLRTNFPYVFPARKGVSPVMPKGARTVLSCEVRSSHESKLRSTSTIQLHLLECREGSAPEIMVVLPYLECPITLASMLRLLGWNPHEDGAAELARLILGPLATGHLQSDDKRAGMRILVHAIARRVETEACMVSREAVLEAVGKNGTHEDDKERRDRYIRYICCSETLPHMGVSDDPDTQRAKRAYLGHMISKLVGVQLGLTEHDDRDHYANKRIDTAGPLMAHLFRQLYRSFLKSLQGQIQRAVTCGKFVDLLDSRKFVNHKRISGGFKMAFGTGNWGTPKIAGGAGSAVGQIGITQQLSRMTGISATAHGRRLNTPLHKEGRNPHPRQLPNSAWGVVCPTETPEGISCGLVTNLAWGARVRVGTPTSLLVPLILGCKDASGAPFVHPLGSGMFNKTVVAVTVNGVILGHCSCHSKAEAFRNKLRGFRRTQALAFDTTIAHIRHPWHDEVRIQGDTGCLLRPVIDVEHVHRVEEVMSRFRGAPHAYPHLWTALLEAGVLEYIDKDEENTLRVAERVEDLQRGSYANAQTELQQQPFTHCEVHPSTIHGVCASLIPFSNHNQSPRNTYQSAMGKQALGVPASNFHHRFDSTMHVLVAPERPLVSTWMDDMTNSQALPAGQNVMVAIMCHTGFNQEDSLIMCQSSVDAGQFTSLAYRTSKEETRPNGTDTDKITVPDASTCTRLKAACYEHLDPTTGVAHVGARLNAGDVLIGKTVTTTDSLIGGGKVRVLRDKSLQVRASEEGEVDRVLLSCNNEGQQTVRVRTRQCRVPEIGDKFCYTPDHDILTSQGWLACAEVTTEHKVLVLDPESGTASYGPVEEVHAYPASEQTMCAIHGPGVELLVTPNHRLYVSDSEDAPPALVEARHVHDACAHYKGCPGGLSGEAVAYPPLPRHSTAEWLLLLGLWKACGSHPELHGFQVPAAHIDEVGTAARICGFQVDLTDGTFEWRCLTDTFSGTSCLPEWCLCMAADHSRDMLRGACLAGGATDRIHAATERLAGQFQILALHAGRTADVVPIAGGWVVHVSDTLSAVVAPPERVVYDGSVHCVTVGTGIIYVRRGGCGVWCGNSSRHGQKGVVGMMRHRRDMPFTPEGLTPDIIVNPHAIPSRMTIGHLFETLLGTEAAHAGELGDGTPFRDLSVEQIAERMAMRGLDRYCETTLRCGLTGKLLEARVFYGLTFYQRLKHMVHDKVHARSRGPVAPLTRQPVEGRSRDGGLRIGEMERDGLAAHGAAANVRESLFERSDPYVAHVCRSCGLLCDGPVLDQHQLSENGWCHACSSRSSAIEVPMPFACKLTLQEITALHISPRLKFADDAPTESVECAVDQGVCMYVG